MCRSLPVFYPLGSDLPRWDQVARCDGRYPGKGDRTGFESLPFTEQLRPTLAVGRSSCYWTPRSLQFSLLKIVILNWGGWRRFKQMFLVRLAGSWCLRNASSFPPLPSFLFDLNANGQQYFSKLFKTGQTAQYGNQPTCWSYNLLSFKLLWCFHSLKANHQGKRFWFSSQARRKLQLILIILVKKRTFVLSKYHLDGLNLEMDGPWTKLWSFYFGAETTFWR